MNILVNQLHDPRARYHDRRARSKEGRCQVFGVRAIRPGELSYWSYQGEFKLNLLSEPQPKSPTNSFQYTSTNYSMHFLRVTPVVR